MSQRSRQKIQQILKAKRTSEANRPYLGDHVQPLLSVTEGAKILGVSVPDPSSVALATPHRHDQSRETHQTDHEGHFGVH